MTTTTHDRRIKKIAELTTQQAELLELQNTQDDAEKRRLRALLVVTERALHWQRARLGTSPRGKHGPEGRKTRKRRVLAEAARRAVSTEGAF